MLGQAVAAWLDVRKEGRPMTMFEVIYLIIMCALLVLTYLSYRNTKK